MNSEDVETESSRNEDGSWPALQHDLELLIERSGLSRAALAEVVGRSPSTVRRWLKQSEPLPWPKAENLIQACLNANESGASPGDPGEMARWRERHAAATASHNTGPHEDEAEVGLWQWPVRGLWNPGTIPLYCATLTLLLVAGVTVHLGLEVRTRRHPPVTSPHEPRWLLSATNGLAKQRMGPQVSRDAPRSVMALHEGAGSPGEATLVANCGKSIGAPAGGGFPYTVTCRVVSFRTCGGTGTALVIRVRPAPESVSMRGRLAMFALSGAGGCM